jgi:hypothetical protein
MSKLAPEELRSEGSLTSLSTPDFLQSLEVVQAPTECLPFVYNSWLKSWERSKECRGMLPKDYYAWQHRRIERLLDAGCAFLLLRAKADPDDYYGWMCSDVLGDVYVVHALYIKHAHRDQGCASLMLVHDFVERSLPADGSRVYTHSHPPFDAFLRKRGFTYLPY